MPDFSERRDFLSGLRRGSLKKMSTAKNISSTLIEAMMKTFSTGRCLRTVDATYGPAVEPIFTSV